MSSDKESFEERLRRISEARGTAAQPVYAGPSASRVSARHRRPGKLWFLSLVAVGAISLAFGANVLIGLVKDTARKMGLEVAADVGPQQPGALDRLLAFVPGGGDDQKRSPIDFLPVAPQGWVRVTTLEAQNANPLAAVRAQWPRIGSDTGVIPLDQNAGIQQLERFLDLNREPDMEQTALSQTRTVAIYLDPKGEFLTVQLEFEPESKPLGTPDDTTSWIEGLAAIEEKKLKAGDVLERLQLGGMDILNRTRPTGQSPIARPIGSDIYAMNAMNIAVPLTHRAILRIEGLATPIIAETLIASTDRKGLLERLE